jgi:hypothetical protein
MRQRPGQTVTEYVHFMRQSFDDYIETCQMIDGSAAIHPHNMGLLMLRGISSSCQYGQAKQCAINAFDTDYLMSSDEVMGSILHLAQNMEVELPPSVDPANNPPIPTPPIAAFVAAGRHSSGGRYNARGGRGGQGPLPSKCSGCGGLDHIMSSCKASNYALLEVDSCQAQDDSLEVWHPERTYVPQRPPGRSTSIRHRRRCPRCRPFGDGMRRRIRRHRGWYHVLLYCVPSIHTPGT